MKLKCLFILVALRSILLVLQGAEIKFSFSVRINDVAICSVREKNVCCPYWQVKFTIQILMDKTFTLQANF